MSVATTPCPPRFDRNPPDGHLLLCRSPRGLRRLVPRACRRGAAARLELPRRHSLRAGLARAARCRGLGVGHGLGPRGHQLLCGRPLRGGYRVGEASEASEANQADDDGSTQLLTALVAGVSLRARGRRLGRLPVRAVAHTLQRSREAADAAAAATAVACTSAATAEADDDGQHRGQCLPAEAPREGPAPGGGPAAGVGQRDRARHGGLGLGGRTHAGGPGGPRGPGARLRLSLHVCDAGHGAPAGAAPGRGAVPRQLHAADLRARRFGKQSAPPRPQPLPSTPTAKACPLSRVAELRPPPHALRGGQRPLRQVPDACASPVRPRHAALRRGR